MVYSAKNWWFPKDITKNHWGSATHNVATWCLSFAQLPRPRRKGCWSVITSRFLTHGGYAKDKDKKANNRIETATRGTLKFEMSIMDHMLCAAFHGSNSVLKKQLSKPRKLPTEAVTHVALRHGREAPVRHCYCSLMLSGPSGLQGSPSARISIEVFRMGSHPWLFVKCSLQFFSLFPPKISKVSPFCRKKTSMSHPWFVSPR